MTIREKTIELIVTTATIVVLSIIVFFASAYGARGLSEMYGDTHQFRIESQLAITAYRWSPFLFATILLGYFWLRLRRVERRWASWGALSLAGLTTALVLYGIVLPFASTTFRMSNH